jgi:peroxiredoxin
MRAKVDLFLLFLVVVFSVVVNPVVGKEKAPDFTLADIDGNSLALSYYRGKVVLLDLFGIRCPPCVSEIEHLKSLYNKYSQDQFAIISIGVDPQDTNDDLRNFAEQYGMDWTVARDTDQVGDRYGVSAIPTLFIVDTNGYYNNPYVGLTSASTLSLEIDSLLSGAGNGGNGDSDGDSGTGQSGPPYTLIAIIGGVVILLVIAGIVVAGQLLGWSESPRKRRSRKRR